MSTLNAVVPFSVDVIRIDEKQPLRQQMQLPLISVDTSHQELTPLPEEVVPS